MAMPLAVPRYTIADLDRFPDDGNRYELLAGALLVTPGPGPSHQLVLGRLTGILWEYLTTTGPAVPVTPGVIQAGDDTQLEPDLLVVPSRPTDPGSWREIEGWWLAVEVSGRDSRVYDRDFKVPAYLRLGVREVWRVDLRDRAVYVSRPGAPLEVPHTHRLTWHPHEMPEPLVVELARVFGPEETTESRG
jgi:Uma2 family endonuclease